MSRMSTKNPITDEQVAACAEIINSIPKTFGKQIGWKNAPKHTAAVVACLLRTLRPKASARIVSKAAGLSPTALYCFMNGKDTGGMRWPELRSEVVALGAECYNEKAPRDAEAHLPEPPSPIVASPMTLATTNKGEVVTATLPTAATTPSAMAAKPGEFATKTDATRCVLDTKTKDILVITTRRIEFGTPAWCEKMVEINSKPKT